MTDIETIPDEAITGELVTAQATSTLFRTDDPVEILQAARTVAGALKGAMQDGDMIQKIGRSEHVKIEGWQTVGAMLGITPHIIWTRPLEDGWEARAEARTLNGRPVSSAEAMCTRAERNWRASDDYALRSMAQTRAMSKALSGPLRFIVTLAGYAATPAEEATDTTPDREYGPGVTQQEAARLHQAISALYGEPPPDELVDNLTRDAGGYLPKIVARGVMLVAAHRPRQPAGPVTHDHPQDPQPAGSQTTS